MISKKSSSFFVTNAKGPESSDRNRNNILGIQMLEAIGVANNAIISVFVAVD
jgi:hypothetical protein